MQKVYSKKASITVFLTLLLLLSASFFFALLETARLKGLGTKADIVSDAALESVFAEYQKEIYENYGLLMLDCAYGSGNFAIENVEKRLQEKNLNNLKQSEKELYGINLTECKIPGYQLLTDNGGNVFRHLAARTAKREALVQEVDDFAEEIQQKETLEQENGTVEERLEEANKTIEEVEQAKQAENTESAEKPEQKESTKNTGNTEEKEKVWDISAQKPQEEVKNPIEDANQWKKSAVLSLVIRDESQLSNKAIALEHTLEHRQKETGNLPVHLERLEAGIFMTQTVGEFEEKTKEAGLDLVIEKPETPVYIMADSRHFWRVIDNLMNNICKYAQSGTRVYINLEVKEAQVSITFRNTSKYPLNISSDELMERFVRGDASRNTEGSGLGLSITNSLMDLMGGTFRLYVDGDLFKVVLGFAETAEKETKEKIEEL